MPRLSIIIPTAGDWKALETTLVAVLQNRPRDSEIIVVVNQPYNDPYELRGEVEFLEIGRRAKPVDLINAGFVTARAEIIHVLTCGAVVDDGWAEPALQHFRDSQIAAVAPLVVDIAGKHVVTAGRTWSRGGKHSSLANGCPLDALPPTGRHWVGPEAFAGFYRRAALAGVGTFDTTLPGESAAADLGLRMLRAGWRVLLECDSQVAVDGNLLPRGGAFSEGWHNERVFWRHVGRGGTARNVVAHGFSLITEMLCTAIRPANALRMAGRLAGVCDRRSARRAELAREPAHAAGVEADYRVDRPHPARSSPRGSGRASLSLSSREAKS